MNRRQIIFVLMFCFVLALTACGKDNKDAVTTPAESKTETTTEVAKTTEVVTTTEAAKTTEAVTTTEAAKTTEAVPTIEEAKPTETQGSTEPEKVLVVVFSVTGNTKKVAEMVAKFENADLYEIVPAEPYSDADINYSDYNCRALKEQADASARPEIGSEAVDISGYTKIYVGYPIWAAKEPRIMDTFAESYDFGSATVIPFCTSGSSDIGTTGTNLGKLAGSGNWQKGKRFPGSATEADIQKWIDGMK
ncbi:MAG: flavodoxin [Lachnospiraceae bacterium]|nr:flavodoxin [Lachnospiraceae bacterium]